MIGKARPLVQHGNVDDSVYVFHPAFQRNSKPPEIETWKMSTTRPSVATTSGDVLLTSAAWKKSQRFFQPWARGCLKYCHRHRACCSC